MNSDLLPRQLWTPLKMMTNQPLTRNRITALSLPYKEDNSYSFCMEATYFLKLLLVSRDQLGGQGAIDIDVCLCAIFNAFINMISWSQTVHDTRLMMIWGAGKNLHPLLGPHQCDKLTAFQRAQCSPLRSENNTKRM